MLLPQAPFRLPQTLSQCVRPYRVPGYPFTPIAFIVAAMALVANTIVMSLPKPVLAWESYYSVLPLMPFWRRTAKFAEDPDITNA